MTRPTLSEPIIIAEGFAADVKHLPRLTAAFAKAEAKARELGLIAEDGSEGDQ